MQIWEFICKKFMIFLFKNYKNNSSNESFVLAIKHIFAR